MSLVKMVFADMDGTFVATDKSVPPQNMELLDVLASRDIGFVPCTGRPVSAVPQQILDHEATRYAVGSNGSVVYDNRAKAPIHVVGMNKKAVLDLYEAVTDTLSRQLCGTGVSAAEIGSDGNNIVITSLKALDKSRQAEYN